MGLGPLSRLRSAAPLINGSLDGGNSLLCEGEVVLRSHSGGVRMDLTPQPPYGWQLPFVRGANPHKIRNKSYSKAGW